MFVLLKTFSQRLEEIHHRNSYIYRKYKMVDKNLTELLEFIPGGPVRLGGGSVRFTGSILLKYGSIGSHSIRGLLDLEQGGSVRVEGGSVR